MTEKKPKRFFCKHCGRRLSLYDRDFIEHLLAKHPEITDRFLARHRKVKK